VRRDAFNRQQARLEATKVDTTAARSGTFWFQLKDEITEFGSGWRRLEVLSIGPKWVRLRCVALGRNRRIDRKTFNTLWAYVKEHPCNEPA